MKQQKSFIEERPKLYLVATPIGNLSEMTPRAIEILKTVDIIAAEDTRNTRKLLTHFDIPTKTISHHEHNKRESTKGLINLLSEGKNIALVSDAGYPLISDPGDTLVKEVLEQGFHVVPISGSSASLNALVASGISSHRFVFVGFVEAKELTTELTRYKDYPETLILFEAPHRIKKTLVKIEEILGNREICLARELTKKYEEFLRGKVSEVLTELEGIKGEMVIVIEGKEKTKRATVSISDMNEMVNVFISQGMSTNEAIKATAKELGIAKNEVYRNYHHIPS